MKMFSNLFSDKIKDLTLREIEKTEVRLFQEKLVLESTSNNVTVLETRLERLHRELLALATAV